MTLCNLFFIFGLAFFDLFVSVVVVLFVCGI